MATKLHDKPRRTRYPGITEIGPRLFRVRLWTKGTKTGEWRETQRRVRGALADARAEQDKARAEAEAGAPARRKRITLADYAEHWIKRGANRGKRGTTLEGQIGIIAHHIEPILGGHYMDAITRADVEAWLDACAGKRIDDATPYAPSTVNLWLRTLRSLLQTYCDEHGVAPNPAARVKPLPVEVDDEEDDGNCLTIDQAGELLAWCRENEPRWYALLYLGLTTGMRFGELTELRRHDIDEDAGRIRVHRAQVRGRVEGTKTRRKRSLPLTPEMREVLAFHWRLRREEAHPPPALVPDSSTACRREGCLLSVSSRRRRPVDGVDLARFCHSCRQFGRLMLRRDGADDGPASLEAFLLKTPKKSTRRADPTVDIDAPDALVFAAHDGAHLANETVAKALRRICAGAGVPVLTPKGFRRTFNDLVDRLGVRGITLRAMTGHSSQAMSDRYSVVRREDKAQAVGDLIRHIDPKRGE